MFRALCGSAIARSLNAHDVMFSAATLREIVMKFDSKSGATLAAAAATLFLAGAVVSTGSTSAYAADGKCMAANACKGQSACKGGANSCKGLNACKGQGFAMMSEAKCKATGGAFVKS